MVEGYACRCKNTDRVMISTGSIPPEKHPINSHREGWFFYVPGWFHTMPVRAFKRAFGFSLKSGTYMPINISISER